MIHNEVSRSREFFKHPVQSGVLAREMEFATSLILGLFLLRAILITLGEHFRLGSLLLEIQGAKSETTDAQGLSVLEFLEINILFLQSHPLFVVFVRFVTSLILASLCWQLGRAFTGSNYSWKAVLSAIIRFGLIAAFIQLGLNILLTLMGPIIGFFALVILMFLAFTFLRVLQGALELPNIFGAIGIVILSNMALIGGASILVMFIAPMVS